MAKKLKKKGVIILSVILSILLVITSWTIWVNHSPEIVQVYVKSENLPQEFDGFTIVQITDFHNVKIGKNNGKVISLVKQANPDVIAITGDLIDSKITKEEVSISLVQRLVQIAPCYYVTGNHEARKDSTYAYLEKTLLSLGVTVLHDQVAKIGSGEKSINIIGLDDKSFYMQEEKPTDEEAQIETRLANICPEQGFNLLLAHRPETIDIYSKFNIDLVLSGHAHGGQWRLPFIGALFAPGQGFFPEYTNGLYKVNGTQLYVSKGLGNTTIPFRFNNRPEVSVITLRFI